MKDMSDRGDFLCQCLTSVILFHHGSGGIAFRELLACKEQEGSEFHIDFTSKSNRWAHAAQLLISLKCVQFLF